MIASSRRRGFSVDNSQIILTNNNLNAAPRCGVYMASRSLGQSRQQVLLGKPILYGTG